MCFASLGPHVRDWPKWWTKSAIAGLASSSSFTYMSGANALLDIYVSQTRLKEIKKCFNKLFKGVEREYGFYQFRLLDYPQTAMPVSDLVN